MTVYPKNLDTAATLITATMRNDLTPARWIRHSKALLLNLGLEYLDGKSCQKKSPAIEPSSR